ncbi:MAG: energy transducer TonB [Raineya sp.]|jgi:protein TonB|nr:energy transducer TonB [Raineya sp.]
MLFDLTDVIFENRNKIYGAYKLRKQYHTSLLIGLLTNIPIIIGLIIWIKWETPQELPKEELQEHIIFLQTNDVELSDIDDMPVLVESQMPQLPQIKNTDVDNDKKEENSEEQNTQKEIEVKDGTEPKKEEKKVEDKKQDEKKGESNTENTPPVLYSKDVWSIYIKKNLVYPEQALKERKECKVSVTVVIQEDGSIKIEKDRPVYGCEDYFNEEVKRLIKNAPKFIPPTNQEGQPQRKIAIAIEFNLPK